MDKNIRFITLSLALAVFGTNLAACSSDQIYGDDSFNESSLEYAEGEDLDFDLENGTGEAAKAEKPKATSSTTPKKTSVTSQ